MVTDMSGENAPEATATENTSEVTEGTPEGAAKETSSKLEELEKEDLIELAKQLRKENAAKRVKNRETEQELEEFRKWKDSQKTELEKAQERAESLQKENYSLLRTSIALGAGLTMEDVEFISGDTPEDMKASAEKLAARVKGDTKKVTTTDVFAGTRGTATSEGPKDPKQIANDYMATLIWGNGR